MQGGGGAGDVVTGGVNCVSSRETVSSTRAPRVHVDITHVNTGLEVGGTGDTQVLCCRGTVGQVSFKVSNKQKHALHVSSPYGCGGTGG